MKVVDDSLRGTDVHAGGLKDEDIANLLDGKTLFVPGITNSTLSSMYSLFKQKYGRFLARRERVVDDEQGYVIWLRDEPTGITRRKRDRSDRSPFRSGKPF